ncbi:TENA/THI-4/PQQC family [Cylindrospermum stagnale PCC 7417]|uniref:TENA/THI-4/PQQC family n=1 Tax=Cylindrospermum stagnale PCC 7417 TaxID=56107 RepID=K9WXH7_9NOST|nr:TENA/THI-4/PQQC family [Cylindrospermum stagnale]AFZ24506.1 TENA/THI-4/PQQC family [Cylindrospermum stagnale PCC 7417]
MKSITADRNIELANQEFTEMRPLLACQVNLYQEQIILSQNDRNFAFQVKGQSRERLQKILLMMDGSHSLQELQEIFSPNKPEIINEIVRNLDKQGFLDEVAESRVNSCIDTLLELEDLTNKLLDESLNENPFWKAINSTSFDLPMNILYGFAMEHYHLLSQNCYFYSPILSFHSSTEIRQLIKELYSQEYGQDELLLAALNTIGINREQLIEIMPLTETMAMYNALTYWANFEPLFLLSKLEVLVERELKIIESYILFCERVELDSSFIQPIKQLTNRKLNRESESLTRRIYQEIPQINGQMRQRLKGQTYLFVELYNNFYKSIWNHYANTSNLLQRVATI